MNSISLNLSPETGNISCDYDYLNEVLKPKCVKQINTMQSLLCLSVEMNSRHGELNVKNLSNGEQQLIKIEDFEKLKSIIKS